MGFAPSSVDLQDMNALKAHGVLGYAAVVVFFSWVLGHSANALVPPRDVTWESTSPTSVELSWTNPDADVLVELDEFRGGAWQNLGRTNTLGLASLKLTVPAASTKSYRMRSVQLTGSGQLVNASAYTDPFEAMTRDDLEISGLPCVLQLPGNFEYSISTEGFSFAQLTLEGVPDSVALIDGPSRIGGTLGLGSYGMRIVGKEGPHVRELAVTVVVSTTALVPPAIASAIQDIAVTTEAANALHDLNTVFEDPDTESTVRMETVLGNIDVALTDTDTPLTVANFLRYADRGAWDGTFFHRSVADFVIQGGGFVPTADGKLMRIKTDPPVMNEFAPSRPNVCGTIAMAKVSGNPNSATNQWFFNTSENSERLDSQNGGFTTFGRVMGRGMEVVTAIADLPTSDFEDLTVITCTGDPPNEQCNEVVDAIFEDWPLLRLRDQGLDTDDLVVVSRIARVSPLEFSLSSNSSPTVAAVSVAESGTMTLDYLTPGDTTVNVTATDLDGLATSHAFTISVLETYEYWARANSLEGPLASSSANGDQDLFANLLEYALGGNPARRDSVSISPTIGLAPSEGGGVPTITFRYRSHSADLDYTVQMTDDLRGEWAPLWHSAQGLTAPNVVHSEPSDNGLVMVTVSAQGASLPTYLRLQVTEK